MTAPRAQSPLPITLLVLTFTTGIVDAVSWVALGHVFTALMTGNVVFLGFAAAGAEELSLVGSVAALAAFMAGAAFGGRLHRAMKAGTHRGWLSRAAVAEVVFLAGAVACSTSYDPALAASPNAGMLGIIACTALAMGVRSATVLRLKDPDLKTTVLTLTITGIAADSSIAGGDNPRVARRTLSVLSLLAGAYVGVTLLNYAGPGVPLAVTATLVLVATAIYVRHPASSRSVAT